MEHLGTNSEQPLTVHMSTLPVEAQLFCSLWKGRMETMMTIGRGYTTQRKVLAAQWGVGVSTLQRYFDDYRESGGDITALLDQRKYAKYLGGTNTKGLPQPFLVYWYAENEDFQRNNSGYDTYKLLLDRLRMWRRGDSAYAIPGYTAPPRNQPGQSHPVGWSYTNLMRKASEAAALAMRRQGRGKAKKFLPQVYTTRAGYEPGRVLMIDDQWHDLQVVWNNGQVARPLSLDLIDFASGFEVLDGFQPRLLKEDGKRLTISETEVPWMMLTYFSLHGYHPDGTLMIFERGTATLRAELGEGFSIASHGKITMDLGGVDTRALKGLMFDSPAKGNFRFKASRESTFNLLRNRAARLMAPTGRNRDESPEEAAALIKYTERLLKQVPQDRWDLLKLPMLTEPQFMSIMADLKAALNNRTDHKLEGYEANNWTRMMFRMPEWQDGEWIPFEDLQEQMLQMTPERREMLSLAIAAEREKLTEPRMLCPREVWEGGRSKLIRLTPWDWSRIIPARMAHQRHVEDNREVRLYGIGPEVLRYDARAINTAGHEIMLRPGTAVMVYANPHMPDMALCCDANGATIGILNRIVPFQRTDAAARIKRMGEVKAMTAHVEAPVARRAEDISKERKDAQRHNERVVKRLPVTAEEHEAQDVQDAASRPVTQWLDRNDTSEPAKPLQEPVSTTEEADSVASFYDQF